MADAFNRWAQLVRAPGAVQVLAHHPIDVPPLNSQPPYENARAGVRLLVRPVGSSPDVYTVDVTSTQVQAMLEGFLRTGNHVAQRLSWRSRGYGVRRKDTIHLRPLKPGE